MPQSPSRKGLDGRIRSGEVRNPEGKNQHSYRADVQRTVTAYIKGELSDEDVEELPSSIRRTIKPGMKRGEALAVLTIEGALRGERPFYSEAIKRVWPAEIAFSGTLEMPTPWWDDLPDVSDLCEEAREELIEAAHIELRRGSHSEREGGDDDDA